MWLLMLLFYGLLFAFLLAIVLRVLIYIFSGFWNLLIVLLVLGSVAATAFGLFYLTLRLPILWMIAFSGGLLLLTTLIRNAFGGSASMPGRIATGIHLVVKVGFFIILALFIYGRSVVAIGRHFKGD